MGLQAAAAQLVVISVILAACVVYTRYHVTSLQRADFTQLDYCEDSKAGNGTRYKVLERSADTGGQSFTIEVLCRAGVAGFLPEMSCSTPEHAHTQQQTEEVLVVSGRLGYKLGHKGSWAELGPGQKLNVPAGTLHVLYNADNTTDLLYQLTHTPAGAMGEAFFENLAGLGWDYGSLDRIHPLQVLVLYDAAGTQLADISGVLAPIVQKVLLPVAHHLGFKADYPSHRSKGAVQQQQQGDDGHAVDGSSVGGEHEEL